MSAGSRTAEEAEDAVLDDDKKQAAHRALVDRVLSGQGRASVEQRARAFSNDGPALADLESAPVEEPLRATLRMLGKLTAEGKYLLKRGYR
jgi:hypothetical protein